MDVLGQAIFDFHKGEKNLQVFQKINGEANEPIEPSYFFRAGEEMPFLEREAIKRAKGSVLDVGSGAGSHALEVQERGLKTVACEISAPCCEVMRQRGLVDVREMPVQEIEGEKFDSILLLMNGLGMSQKLEFLTEFLTKLKDLLNPGGQIIGDSSDILYWFAQPDGSVLLPGDDYYGEIHFELEYKDIRQEFDWLFVDPATLVSCAGKAGLKIVDFVDGHHHDYLAVLEANGR